MTIKHALTLLMLISFPLSGSLATCLNPQEGTEAATIERPGLKENSGIDFSNKHPGVFWAINDEGPTDIFAIGVDGQNLGRFKVNGSKNIDWEDISLARCLHDPNKDCVYIADTGNNDLSREELTIYIVEEPQDPKIDATLNVISSIDFKLPGKYNVEAMAVNDSNGEIYFFSKNEDATTVFILKKDEESASALMILDFGLLPYSIKAKDKIITAADFDANSGSLLLGSNDNAFEVNWSDLGNYKEKMKKIKIPKMRQTEAMAYYLKDSKLYIAATSEGKRQPLYLISCQ
jgi:hypothetical protein